MLPLPAVALFGPIGHRMQASGGDDLISPTNHGVALHQLRTTGVRGEHDALKVGEAHGPPAAPQCCQNFNELTG